MAIIYGLVDPRDGKIFYVGATSQKLSSRLASHIANAKNGELSRKQVAIRKLLSENLKPLIVKLEECVDWDNAERKWIAFFGETLTNSFVGGSCHSKLFYARKVQRNHSSETKQKIRKAKLGISASLQAKKKMSKTRMGKPFNVPNKNGLKGVVAVRNGFVANFTRNKKRQYLGFFKTKEEAGAAYARKFKEVYGHDLHNLIHKK